MAEHAIPHKLPTAEEYLEMEEAATVKHEYVSGVIHAHASTAEDVFYSTNKQPELSTISRPSGGYSNLLDTPKRHWNWDCNGLMDTFSL